MNQHTRTDHDDVVRLDQAATGTQHRVPIGKAPGGAWVHVDLEQTPHARIIAKSGRGATSLLRYLAAWTAGHGAQVTICDANSRDRATSPYAPLTAAGVDVRAGLNDILDATVEHRESNDAAWRALVRETDLDAQLDNTRHPTRFLLVDGLPVLQAAALASGRGTWQQIWGHLTTLTKVGSSVRHYLVVAGQHVTELDNVFDDTIGVHVGLEPVSLATRWKLFRDVPAGCFSRSHPRGAAVVRTSATTTDASTSIEQPDRSGLWKVTVPYLTNAEAADHITGQRANQQASTPKTEDA